MAGAVRDLLAVQSQDYRGATWAVGQRVAGATEAEVNRAFDAGEIVRTHVLRPTWHFVAPEDLRWLLALTGPRVQRAMASIDRTLGIDRELIARAAAIFERAIDRSGVQTREELGRALAEVGIEATAGRLAMLVLHLELAGLICSGPRCGRTQTYAIVDERVPPAPARSRDEALAELARRYVQGHGPAQAVDLAWWSGLSLGDARRGLAAASPELLQETIDGRTFWSSQAAIRTVGSAAPAVHLLPNYDELLVAFRDRSDAMDPRLPPSARVAAEILSHVLVRDGLVVGGWRRTEGGRSTRVQLDLLVPLGAGESEGLAGAIERLSTFLGRPVAATGLD